MAALHSILIHFFTILLSCSSFCYNSLPFTQHNKSSTHVFSSLLFLPERKAKFPWFFTYLPSVFEKADLSGSEPASPPTTLLSKKPRFSIFPRSANLQISLKTTITTTLAPTKDTYGLSQSRFAHQFRILSLVFNSCLHSSSSATFQKLQL